MRLSVVLGLALAGVGAQKNCPPGKYTGGCGSDAKCIDCERGTYASEAGASACTRASRGYYVDEPGATSPKMCEVGRYAGGEGFSSCTDANAGFFVADEAACITVVGLLCCSWSSRSCHHLSLCAVRSMRSTAP